MSLNTISPGLYLTNYLMPFFDSLHAVYENQYIPTTCAKANFPYPTTRSYWFFALGLSCGTHLLLSLVRIAVTKKANILGNLIVINVMVWTFSDLMLCWLDPEPYVCTDFLGVEMNPLLWMEWILTVPGMFVVVPLNSIKTQEDRNKMTWIFTSGFFAVFCLILGNVPISYTLNMLFFLAANYLMTWALVYQQYWIWEMHRDAKAELDKLGPTKAHSELFQDISNRADVTKNQFYLATYMSISYCVFPLLYYLRMRRDISLEWYTIVTYNVSFLSKYLYSHLVFETHAAVMDNSQYQLLEDKKRIAASKEMLLRFVFHEVRVPLNSLSLGIQFLKATAGQGGEVAKEAATEVLEMMAEGTTFMGETLNDVLSFQKIEDGAMTLEYTWFEPKKLMKAISSTFKSQLTNKRITLLREIRNGVPRLICGDQFRLEHILSNFVSNAIKFSSEDSTITVVVSYETHYPDMVTFSVFDQGIGISEENQNKLFKVFSQIDAGKNQKGNGSGLGLSICKNLIELHQGEIGCNSSERTNPNDPTSGGSEFYFCVVHDEEYMQEYIREHGDELGEEGEKSARNNAAQIQEFLSTKSFMVVDDAVSNCKMLARLLSQRSCKVVDTAFNGLELLDATLYYKPGRVNFYDFIFIDSNMPKMGGPESVGILRKAGYMNLIIGLTGDAMEDDILMFEQAGADAVISKPLKPSTLDKLLEYTYTFGFASPEYTHDGPGRQHLKSYIKG